ncbi:DinB family protein [Flavitalea sp.]|nr:DinB family protein [Flavitalea sp.]
MTEKEMLIGEIKREAANTRKMLERLQDAHLPWKPHEKSYTTAKLAQHISNIPTWISLILNSEGLDLANPLPRLEPLTSAAELLAFFDERLATCLSSIEQSPDSGLEKTWALTQGETIIIKAPKKIVMRYLVLNHIVHHRGQLSLYLRLQDIPVPGMYGPSADERDV